MRNFDRLVTFYLLRAVLYYGLFDKVNGHTADRVIEGLGYGEEQIKAIGGMSNFLKELKKRHDDILKNMPKFPAVLDKNLKMISEKLNLDETQKQILGFLIIVLNSRALENTIGKIEDIHNSDFNKMIAIILNLPQRAVNNALKHDGKLIGSGLLVILSHEDTFCCKYGFINGDFAFEIFENKNYFNQIFLESIVPCGKGDLKSCDYGHIKDELALTLEYLKNAISTKRHGVNILLYGPAGTGKTEFAKLVAKEIGLKLFEVAYNKFENDKRATNRYLAYTLAQNVLSDNILLMYDEAEDIFSLDNGIMTNKAAINRALENNKIATIWITNKVQDMDEAVLRRFDIAINLPIPDEKTRKRIIEKYSNGLSTKESVKRLLGYTPLSPAVIQKAAKVALSLDKFDKQKAFEMVIDNTLKSQGHSKDKRADQGLSLPQSYNVEFINASTDLDRLTHGIKESRNARICIYGAAGTGKSAYAKFVAKSLNKPLVLKKSSDLINQYIGETEKNIAQAFKEAREKGAVLVFDEVDTFLQDRNNAVRNCEISQVNEMLVQMENFEGIFIATTNLLDRLDSASIRRFDMKIEFSYLKSEQALSLFKKECEILGLKASSSDLKLVGSFAFLTPGDFAAVLRANKFSPLADANEFANRLNDEIRYKKIENERRVGF